MTRLIRHAKFSLAPSFYSGQPSQPCHAVLPAADAGLFQSPPSLNRTVSFFGVPVNFADLREQNPIPLAAPALFSTVSVVIPAAADL
jgi:hypothetical protein